MLRAALQAAAIGLAVSACAAPAATDESARPSAQASASASVSPSASVGLDPTPFPHTVATDENPELRDELLAMQVQDQAVAKGLPQVYGTQVGADASGELAPRTPIEDPEHVDERRASAGLGTLGAYYEEIRQSFESLAPSATPSE